MANIQADLIKHRQCRLGLSCRSIRVLGRATTLKCMGRLGGQRTFAAQRRKVRNALWTEGRIG
jgi:hypothetical protein